MRRELFDIMMYDDEIKTLKKITKDIKRLNNDTKALKKMIKAFNEFKEGYDLEFSNGESKKISYKIERIPFVDTNGKISLKEVRTPIYNDLN